MSSFIALGVLPRVLLAVPAPSEGWWARWRQHRRAIRGYVWEADATDAFVDILEDAEGVLAAGRIAGVLPRDEYHDQMRRVAQIDDDRRPVRVPQTRGI